MNVFGDNVLSVYPYKHEKIVVCAHIGKNYNHCSDKKIGRVDLLIKWVPIYSLDFISTHMINISIRTLIVSLLASLVAASVRGSAIQSLSVDPI